MPRIAPRLAALAGLTLLGGCATTVADLKAAKKDHASIKRDVKAQNRHAKRMDRYAGRIEAGDKPGNVTVIGRSALMRLIEEYMPYKLEGRAFHSRLRGRFRFSNPSDLRLLARNRASLRMELTGRKAKLLVKGFSKEKRKAAQALAAGVVLDLVVDVSYSRKRNMLTLSTQCTAVQLREHDSSTNRSRIRSALNSGIFRPRKFIELPSRLKGDDAHFFTTENHLVFAR